MVPHAESILKNMRLFMMMPCDSMLFDQKILEIVGKVAEPANIRWNQFSLDAV